MKALADGICEALPGWVERVVERDSFAEERFPDDDYDLTPTSFGDIDPHLRELGLMWGAAKAWEHKQRHAGSQEAHP